MLSTLELPQVTSEPSWDFLNLKEQRMRWFKLTPVNQAVDFLVTQVYGQRYVYSTSLTSKLQISQLLE